jgi:hypothetical protein
MATPNITVAIPSVRNSLGIFRSDSDQNVALGDCLPLPSGKTSSTRYSIKRKSKKATEDTGDISTNIYTVWVSSDSHIKTETGTAYRNIAVVRTSRPGGTSRSSGE